MAKLLRHGSLFTGVGGVDLGLGWAGFKTAWQVEICPFARTVLERRWPEVPKFADVRDCGKANLDPVVMSTGGFPCSDVSVAGRKKGLGTEDCPTERSGLWFECRRIIRELRPRWVLIENVSRLLDTADGDTVLDGLEEIGYAWWPRLLDAGALGAPHRRERAWILCRDRADGHSDIEAAMVGQGALPPDCRDRMGEALERWDYWKRELARGAGHGCPAMTTTPTATAVLEAEWPDGRIRQNGGGRWRKRSKRGTEGSMSWAQEMAARAVAQRNPRLVPTAECCEEFMGFPAGWTRVGEESTELPNEWIKGWGEESDADAYAQIVREVHRMPDWPDRVKALGNAVVVQVPMLIGACIQEYESRLPTAALARAGERKEDGLSRNLAARIVPVRETREDSSEVEVRFESLGVEGTRKTYRELNAALEGLASRVVQTMRQIVPYLAGMQSLLSQRGADRRMVLRKAGLPGWTEWAERYAKSLDCTIRTIQVHIKLHREEQERGASGRVVAAKKLTRGSGGSKPFKLTGRQQSALIKAQLVMNDLVTALKSGGDWKPLLVKYEKVAAAPPLLGAYLDGLSREPDWKAALTSLVNALEPCADRLTPLTSDAMNAARSLLGGKTSAEATVAAPAPPTFPYPDGKDWLASGLVASMPAKGLASSHPDHEGNHLPSPA